jgi:hypothetical protein
VVNRQQHSVFVSIARPFKPDLVFLIRDALQLPGITPNVYYGIKKPVGDVVRSPYVEARGELLAADIAFLVLATDGAGQLSDDWTLDFLNQLEQAGIVVVVYLVRSDVSGTDCVSESAIDIPTANVRTVPLVDDVPDMIAAEVVHRFGNAPA